jgi:hypothetical protein
MLVCREWNGDNAACLKLQQICFFCQKLCNLCCLLAFVYANADCLKVKHFALFTWWVEWNCPSVFREVIEGMELWIHKKVKVPRSSLESPEGRRSLALHSLVLDARRGGMVSTTPLPLYPRKRPGTPYTGCWVGPGLVWTRAKNLAPNGIRSPDRPARSQSLSQSLVMDPYILQIDTQRLVSSTPRPGKQWENSRDSSVGIVIKIRVENWKNRASIPGMAR